MWFYVCFCVQVIFANRLDRDICYSTFFFFPFGCFMAFAWVPNQSKIYSRVEKREPVLRKHMLNHNQFTK